MSILPATKSLNAQSVKQWQADNGLSALEDSAFVRQLRLFLSKNNDKYDFDLLSSLKNFSQIFEGSEFFEDHYASGYGSIHDACCLALRLLCVKQGKVTKYLFSHFSV